MHVRILLSAICCAALLLSACEEDVTAVLGTERPFSLFGVLTPQADTQWVRVYTIDDVLRPIPPEPLTAVFVSTDLATGEQRVWRDSLIREADGMVAHVFWAPFAAAFDRTYRLEVTDPAEARTRVEARVPPPSELVLPPQALTAPSVLLAEVVGDVPNLIRIEVTYRYKFLTPEGVQRGESLVSYDGQERRTPGGWTIQLFVGQDLRTIQRVLEESVALDRQVGLKLVGLTLRLIAADAAWRPPGNTFDLNALVQPGVMSNVENGFGFVGAGYRLEASWVPFDTLLAAHH